MVGLTATGFDPDGNPITDDSDDPNNPTDDDPDNDGDPDDPTVTTLAPDSDITITKAQAPGTYNTLGQLIPYNLVVTNTGNTTLSNVTVTDANADAGSITPATIASIAPGASVNVTATHTITQADLDLGTVTNTAMVTGDDPNGTTIIDDSDDPNNPTDSDPNGDGDPDDPTVTTIDQTADIVITKASAPGPYTTVGDVITYNIEVTNTGNVTASNVQITDANADTLAPAFFATIAPGVTEMVTATHIVTQADIDAGEVVNTAFAEGEDPDGNPLGPNPSDDPNTPDPNDPTTTVIDQTTSYTVEKVDLPATDGAYDMVGEVIAYEITITNTGTTTLSNFVVTDANADSITPAMIASMYPGMNVVAIATHIITQADLDAGSVDNQATVTADGPDGNPAGPEDSDDPDVPGGPDVTNTPLSQDGDISITKAQNAPADGSYDTVGEQILYTIEVTNTGNVTLTNVAITDANADSITPSSIGTLDPGETATATAIHTITQADIDAGVVTNTAVATGDDPNGPVTDDSDDPDNPTNDDPDGDGDPDDPTDTIIDQNSDYIVEKVSDAPADGSYDTVGEAITYTITVTNTGNTTLSNVDVTDANATITGGSPIASLDPGMSTVVTAEHIITQADLDAGEVVNVAIATADEPDGNPAGPVSSDDPNTPDPQDPTITDLDENGSFDVTKAVTSTGPYDTVGQQVTYDIVVTNNGNVTLSGITIGDANADSVTPSTITSLAPGVSVTAVAIHTITQADLDAGTVVNTALVVGTTPDGDKIEEISDDPNDPTDDDTDGDGDPDDPTVVDMVNQTPEIRITKASDAPADGSYDTVGEQITYTIVVENTGNTTLTDVVVSDPNADAGSITPASIAVLMAGEMQTVTATHTITQADIDAGTFTNVATVTGNDPNGMPVDDESDDPNDPTDTPDSDGDPGDPTVTTIDQTNAFTITKADQAPLDGSYDTVGEVINYTIVVTNTGTTTLDNVVVTDPNADTITPATIGTMAPGDVVTVIATHAITQADLDAGSVTNTATVNGDGPDGTPLTPETSDDPDTATPDDPTITTVDQDPMFTLTKVDDAPLDGAYDTLGEVITYTIVVTNTGNVTLSNVVVTDPDAVITGGSPVATLDPGMSATITAEHVITQGDLDAGIFSNQATVNGDGPDGTPLIPVISDDPDTPDMNDATITDTGINGLAELTVTKEALTTSYSQVGDVITYEIVIANSGQLTMSNIQVTDPNATIVTGLPVPDLIPGASATVTAEHIVTAQDINNGFIDNQATITGENSVGDVTTSLSDDPNNPIDIDSDNDGLPDDITSIFIDSDGDGINDVDDLDDDNDGITDVEEMNGDPNLDTDGDGIIDRLDLDSDGDGVNDVSEAGHDDFDLDGDGQLDTPVGADGIPDGVQDPGDEDSGIVNYPMQDSDGDGIDDFQDTDDDGDNVPTSDENPNPDGDGDPLTGATQDSDGDGIPDYLDQDDDGDGVDTVNEDYDGDNDPQDQDSDGDGIPDYLDIDDDNDGIDTQYEDPNPDNDQDPDTGDTKDSDGDGIPDYLDIDDGDGIPTEDENPDPNGDGNPDDAQDSDGDGIPDYLENDNGDPNAPDGLTIFDIMTPNGDGKNDVFVIKGIEQFPDNTVEIYNRWGVKVYDADGYGQDDIFFRGESNGRTTVNADRLLPVGTYYYVLRYVNGSGATIETAGPLYINR